MKRQATILRSSFAAHLRLDGRNSGRSSDISGEISPRNKICAIWTIEVCPHSWRNQQIGLRRLRLRRLKFVREHSPARSRPTTRQRLSEHTRVRQAQRQRNKLEALFAELKNQFFL